MQIDLRGKTALICGSTQGIGWATAKLLSTAGANCILVGRNEAALKGLLPQLSGNGSHSFELADFSKTNEVEAMISRLKVKAPIHILINNTGGPKAGTALDAQPDQFLAAFQQHLICNHLLATALVPGMKEQGYGRIINIVSTSVRIPIANLGVSNTVRAAVASWAKTLSNEIGAWGITVNSVLPGFTDTQRLKSLIHSNSQQSGISEDELANSMKLSIPAKRFGTAEEIGNVVVFLASPLASYINGVSIPVDGGKTGTI